MKSLRPDEVKRHIKEFDDGFGDVVVGIPECGYGEHPSLAGPLIGEQFTFDFTTWMVLVIGKPNTSVVGEMDDDSHTVFLPSIIEPLTITGTRPWTTLKNGLCLRVGGSRA